MIYLWPTGQVQPAGRQENRGTKKTGAAATKGRGGDEIATASISDGEE